MTAAVTITNNVAEMAYIGEKPWHGLGNQLTRDASIDQWIKDAGMEWTIQSTPVLYQAGGASRTMGNHVVLHRSDNQFGLSIVTDKFRVVQPREVLEFFRDLCEHNHFEMETAGTLFGGRKFWALANIGQESFVIGKNDRITGRILLATACDGSMQTTAKFVAERVVCQNTLSIALAEHGKAVKVSHRTEFDVTKTKQDLGLGVESFDGFMGSMRKLAKVKVTQAKVEDMTAEILRKPEVKLTKEERRSLTESRPAQEILRLFNGSALGSDLPGVAGTAYGWLNAVTEYVDHRSPTRTAENRFNKSLFGKHDRLKQRAEDLALELI